MNAQPHGAGGEQDGPLPETILPSTREAGPDEAAEPTPVTSPVSTRTMPVGSAYDERPAQHTAPGLESLAQAPGIPAEGWGAPAAMPRNGSATQSWTVKRGLAVAGAAVVHAEYVVLQGSDHVTKAAQLGTVTEISSGAVTVKSTDGFSRTYVLGADVLVSNQQQRRQQAGSTGSQLSVADIVPGGTVRIVSAKNGTDYTAESVILTTAAAGGAASGTGQAS
jgi:hypothetical protein